MTVYAGNWIWIQRVIRTFTGKFPVSVRVFKNLLNVHKEAILFNEVEFLPLIVAERTEDCLCARKQSYRAGWKLILSILILNDMNLKTGSWGWGSMGKLKIYMAKVVPSLLSGGSTLRRSSPEPKNDNFDRQRREKCIFGRRGLLLRKVIHTPRRTNPRIYTPS